MSVNEINQSISTTRYEPTVAVPKKDVQVKSTEQAVPKDKVEISAEAKLAADLNKVSDQSSTKQDVLKMSAEERAELVAGLKAKMEQDQAKMFDFVRNTLSTQGIAFEKADDIWKFIASGKYEVDAETKAKAKAAIEDGGYYSVEETANRLFDFAVGLSGGDPEKMKKMEAAVEQGFKEATKSWGKELPEISSRTYDEVKEKFKTFYESISEANEVKTK